MVRDDAGERAKERGTGQGRYGERAKERQAEAGRGRERQGTGQGRYGERAKDFQLPSQQGQLLLCSQKRLERRISRPSGHRVISQNA